MLVQYKRGNTGASIPMSEARLFSYGTLRNPELQISLFGKRLEGRADAITGFRKRIIEISDPDVIAKSGTRWHPIVECSGDPSDAIEGQVFCLTDEDLAKADAYEVDYVRRDVKLRSGLTAYIYSE